MRGMKTLLAAAALTAAVAGTADATLTAIGEATYEGTRYKLIWDNDGPNGPVVWLDYSRPVDTWENQVTWASGLTDNLTVELYPGYSLTWTDSNWRLPSTVDGLFVYGYDGTTTAGYNISSSELGHLFYTELGNLGYFDTSGVYQPGWGLSDVGQFEHLISYWYWSGTASADSPGTAWNFSTNYGDQSTAAKATYDLHGMAVRSGQVEFVPVSEPSIGLIKKRRSR